MDPHRLSRAVLSLVELVARLRGPGGCPWDAKQTDATVKMYLLEEAYEVLEAVEGGAPEHVCQELGDLLFQILFLARLGEEEGAFDFVQVVERIIEKMIRRHPHVFADAEAASAEDVRENWARIKQEEEASDADAGASLRRVTTSLPALLRAHRLTERVSSMGFQRDGNEKTLERIEEAAARLRQEAGQDTDEMRECIAALLFDLADLARQKGLNAENLLRMMNQEFLDRIDRMEAALKASGVSLEGASDEQRKRAWEESKE
jgi:MazG family protein